MVCFGGGIASGAAARYPNVKSVLLNEPSLKPGLTTAPAALTVRLPVSVAWPESVIALFTSTLSAYVPFWTSTVSPAVA